MSIAEYGLPVALLILIFLCKLLIDRRISLADFIVSVLEFPQSIAILGVSLIIAFTVLSTENVHKGLVLFVVYLILTIIIVFLWRRAEKNFYGNRVIRTLFLGCLSYSLCVPALLYSINIIVVG